MSTTQGHWQDVDWTPREREVTALIGRGRTNAEIADELGISFTTAKWHVSEVISKLGVTCREEVAEYWREQRGMPARWRSLRKALAALPVLKLGLGGTVVAGFAVGAVVVGGWAAGGGPGRAFQLPEPTPSAIVPETEPATPSPTPTPFPPDSGPWYTTDQSPEGCPRASTEGFHGLICDWRNYPEVVAATGTETCDLSGATIEDANLNHIDLRECLLEGTTIRGGQAAYADFSEANATGLILDDVGLTNVIFWGTDLRGATFHRIASADVDFSNANLLGADFRQSHDHPSNTWRNTTCPDGSSSDASGRTCMNHGRAAEVDRAIPDSVSSECAALAEQARPCEDDIEPDGGCGWDINLQPGGACAREHFPALRSAAGNTCNLRGADLADLELHFVDLRGCDLTGADLSGSDLTRGSLEGAILDGANLTGAWLRLASVEGASLRGSVLLGVLMLDTNIKGADFTGSTLADAGGMTSRYYDSTCPDGSNSDIDDGDRQTCLNNLR